MRLLHFLILIGCAMACRADFAVVVPNGSAIEMLNEEQVAGIFLGKTNRFPNGERAQPMELNNTELRTRFYEAISGKSLTQLNSYWATLVFTGKGRPPRVVNNMTEVIEKLPDQPGTITYVPLDKVTASMKVVFSPP